MSWKNWRENNLINNGLKSYKRRGCNDNANAHFSDIRWRSEIENATPV